MKWVLYMLFALMYLLTTFFGLGPVLFADGSAGERGITLVIVLVIYAVITIGMRGMMKRLRRH